jgi:hypothetical protein
MKTVKLGVCVAIVLLFAAGLLAPVQAGDLDATWWKARIQGDSRLFTIDSDGDVEKIKLSGDFYFKTCDAADPDILSICDGVEYLTPLAIADFDDDGIFELDEVFDFTVFTCGDDESGFLWFIVAVDIADEVDPVGLVGEGLGRVKGEETKKLRANVGDGGGAVEVDDLGLGFGPNGYFRKISVKANPVAVEDLPFTLDDLVDEGIIGVPGDLDCLSELVVVPAAE